jgi:hypothetical protein
VSLNHHVWRVRAEFWSDGCGFRGAFQVELRLVGSDRQGCSASVSALLYECLSCDPRVIKSPCGDEALREHLENPASAPAGKAIQYYRCLHSDSVELSEDVRYQPIP